ncbi:MAG: ECF transporter S component, partial [Clostridia bacterium]|nr:ECF transporter S component [Clostridia bacterium]
MENQTNTRFDTKKLIMLALMSAIAYVVMFLSKQIPINVLGFLTFDLKDAVICIAGFLFGPLAAAEISVVVSFIEMYTISSTGIWGFIMNVLSTCTLACTAAWFYQRKRTQVNAILGLIVGVLLMSAVMVLWNYLITPIYMTVPREQIIPLLIPT